MLMRNTLHELFQGDEDEDEDENEDGDDSTITYRLVLCTKIGEIPSQGVMSAVISRMIVYLQTSWADEVAQEEEDRHADAYHSTSVSDRNWP